MNLEGLKTLKELHQLLQIGAITADDFNVKKNEILQLQSNISAEDRIELLKELHQAMQDNIISQEDFDAIKPKLLNTVENNHIDFFDSEEKEENY
ncbi:MAG: SHOCT domain-containing protein, partial [Cloacibacterium sp.]|nr:SHOCT domain-containing protein [Cloacibacterium sp.]